MCIECNRMSINAIKKEIERNVLLRKDAIVLTNRRLIDTTSRKIAEEISKLKGQYDEIRRLHNV